MSYKGYTLKPITHSGSGFLINGQWVKQGFVAVKGGCNPMPGAIWFQTEESARECIDILEEFGREGFWKEHARRKRLAAAMDAGWRY